MIIDVHAHLNDEKLILDIEKILEECRQNDIKKVIGVGYDFNSSRLVFDLSQKYKEIYCAIGIHPSAPNDFEKKYIDFLRGVADNKKVVAVGEIGLDYHYEPFSKSKQQVVFLRQLELADSLHLPVQIHCRDAVEDTINLLKTNKHLLNSGGIFHCFSENIDVLNEVQKLGLKISVGGIVTFKNAKNIVEMVKKMPIDMLTLETDCPYLTPHPHRGVINNPNYIILTAEKIAELKNISYNELCEITTRNAENVFKKLVD